MEAEKTPREALDNLRHELSFCECAGRGKRRMLKSNILLSVRWDKIWLRAMITRVHIKERIVFIF